MTNPLDESAKAAADPYIALRYAHRIDPDVMAGFARDIDPTARDARYEAARLRRRLLEGREF